MGTLRFLHPFSGLQQLEPFCQHDLCPNGYTPDGKDFYAVSMALLCSSIPVISKIPVPPDKSKSKGDHNNGNQFWCRV